jgi:hypothetical protein
MSPTGTWQNDLDRLQMRSLIVGLIALAACAFGAFTNLDQFFRSYLMAFLFWGGLSLGCFSALMIYHAAGGNWGFISRRLLESAVRIMPFVLLMLIPVLLGLNSLYEWTRPAAVATNEVIQRKALYLNLPFFFLRLVIYFTVWFALSYFLNRWSAEQDRTADPSLKNRLKSLSSPGLLIHGFMVTFLVIDLVMSLQAEWFSTIFGMIFLVGQLISAVSFLVLMLMLLGRHEPLASTLQSKHFHDLGNLMLAFVILFAYLSYSQFLLIWSANLPNENPWYLRRLFNGWGVVAWIVLLFHFAVPFLLLLMRFIKRRGELLAYVAVGLIIMRNVELYWTVEPAFHPGALYFHWLDVAAPIGLGGIWLALFSWQLKSRPLLPLHDDRIPVEDKY